MATKLWEKSVEVNKDIERFTVGRDREMDLYLAKYDVLGSMAHITMLETIGLLTADELQSLLAELKTIYAQAERGEFVIEEGVEDVHSQVELMLTRRGTTFPSTCRAERTLQRGAYARLYAPADSHALVVRPLVWCLRRELGR